MGERRGARAFGRLSLDAFRFSLLDYGESRCFCCSSILGWLRNIHSVNETCYSLRRSSLSCGDGRNQLDVPGLPCNRDATAARCKRRNLGHGPVTQSSRSFSFSAHPLIHLRIVMGGCDEPCNSPPQSNPLQEDILAFKSTAIAPKSNSLVQSTSSHPPYHRPFAQTITNRTAKSSVQRSIEGAGLPSRIKSSMVELVCSGKDTRHLLPI